MSKISSFQFFTFLTLFALFAPVNPFLLDGGLIVLLGTYMLVKRKSLPTLTPLEKKYYKYFIWIWFFFFFNIAISITIGVLFGNVVVIERDLFEFHRPVLYILVFTFAFFTFFKKSSLDSLNTLLIMSFIGIITIGLMQFFRINENLLELYTKNHNIVTSRVAAPFVNPYDFAFVMSFFMYYFFVATLYRSWMFIFPFFIASSMFVLSQSRSVAAGFLIGFFIVTPIVLTLLEVKLGRYKISKLYFYYLLVFTGVILGLLSLMPYLLENFRYLTDQFVEFIKSKEIGSSGNTRLEQIMFALEKAKNPLIFFFGNGPSKLEMEYVESMYTYQFYRYGLVGIIMYLIYPILLALVLLWRLLKIIERKSFAFTLFLATILWLLSHPLMFIGNNFTEQIRTSFIYYSLLGIVVAQYVYHRQKVKS